MIEWQASIVADDRKKKIRSGYDKHLVADAAEVAKWPHVPTDVLDHLDAINDACLSVNQWELAQGT